MGAMVNFPLRMGLTFLVFFLSVASATADQRTLGMQSYCSSEFAQFTMASVNFDGNKFGFRKSEKGYFGNLNISSKIYRLEDRNTPVLVTECQLVKHTLTVSRIYFNIPRNRGMCGGADWAVYSISIDENEVARLHNGCGADPYVYANDAGLTVCQLTGPEAACKRIDLFGFEGAPNKVIYLNLWGKWQ